ncbi:hypothetical protein RDI58_025294 [Solanum bulbocastanum]|uniref:Uncharacterized protein n=1 Tax=Solanum bulbocastanum TaxID=147425 RepID=A0AAN8T4T3_SOLBU
MGSTLHLILTLTGNLEKAESRRYPRPWILPQPSDC